MHGYGEYKCVDPKGNKYGFNRDYKLENTDRWTDKNGVGFRAWKVLAVRYLGSAKKEYSEKKSVENLKTPDHAENLTFLNNEQSENSKNSLSSQIRKLSNFVQNEAEIAQRQVHLLEENRSAAKKEQKYQTMQIQIPHSSGVIPVENSANMLTINNLQSPLVSPNVSSLGKYQGLGVCWQGRKNWWDLWVSGVLE